MQREYFPWPSGEVDMVGFFWLMILYIIIPFFFISGILRIDSVLVISMLLFFMFGWIVIIALNRDSNKKKRVKRQLDRERRNTEEQEAEDAKLLFGVGNGKTLQFNI